MQAILIADYSFTPLEYWRGVSLSAREFIKRCLTIDGNQRMTAHEALSHPWIAQQRQKEEEEDLLPTVKKNFNARRTLHAAIDTIRAINQLRAGGGAAMMDGVTSKLPDVAKKGEFDQGDAMDVDEKKPSETKGSTLTPQSALGGLDPRGNARGQTEEMIREQERRVRETAQGMLSKRQ